MKDVERRHKLAAVRRLIERWRKSHGGRGRRIPEPLWNEAARVARVEGVYETARALRLEVERLKHRMGGSRTISEDRGGRAADGAAFVELTGMASLGGGRTVVDLVNRGGEQMRMHLAGASTAELVGLAEAFWSRRS